MEPLDAKAVAALLTEFGLRTELRGGNPYRARAYQRAAETLLALSAPLADVVAQGRLRELPGIGETIADIVTKLHRTGTHPALESMRAELPAGLLELVRIPGLKPDKIFKLHNELGISSLAELEQAARDDRIAATKGLGPALQRKILDGIAIQRRSKGLRHIHRAAELAESAIANLQRSHPELTRIVAAGELRRGCELVGELSFVAEVPELQGLPRVQRLSGLALHVADPRRYGITLLLATGSDEHVSGLTALAATKGLRLDEDGLHRGKRVIAGRSEEEIYAALRLPLIAPELREGRGEIEQALAGKLPRLVRDEDIRGILHAHTDASDGMHTLAQMVEATRKRGYGYFGVADHSRSAGYAGGLSLEEIEAQHAAVDKLNKRLRGEFRVLKGIESDILADGSLDYPDEVLARFDFVVASVHSRFRLDPATQTERIIRAVANPHTTILGHMTGRQLLRRPGYEIDIEKVLAACAQYGVAVEINANPWRLDLDWRWHARALELGCTMSINPDAHSTAELDLTRWGVTMARKGGVPPDRVLNCLPLAKLEQVLAERMHARKPRAAKRKAPRPPTLPQDPRANGPEGRTKRKRSASL
ncbi:MAG TPA: PHP domain-containing protein [Xanthobacteraceae bacterium]